MTTLQEKINQCTPEGICTGPSEACRHHKKSFINGLCVFVMIIDAVNGTKCLSPFALTEARGEKMPAPPAEKGNYCSAKGVCTAETYEQESSCTHYDQGAANGICRKRAWCDVCCSVDAVKAAKEAA